MRHFFIFFLSLSLLASETINALPQSPQSILELIKTEHVEFIDFLFTDLLGTLRTITITAHEMPHALKNGLTFDGSSIPGCTSIHESDMVLRPDLDTFMVLPSQDFCTTARVICDIYAQPHNAYDADPRGILKKVLEEAHELGYVFYVGPELEFFLFLNPDTDQFTPCDTEHYFQAEECGLRDAQNKLLLRSLLDQGVAVEKLHHEVAPGQHEVSIHYADALSIADQIMICKHTIKSFAKNNNLTATFMPKPINGQNGSGMHIHFSLFESDTKTNAFYDKESATLLSATAQSFIAGVLDHALELSALCNPSINSYKRLVPGHEAPIYRCWATKNRSAMIRIPQIDAEHAAGARAEIRSPDAMANPYLLFAGLLKAGLDGIKNQTRLPVSTDMNLYRLKTSEINALGISILPTSLEQSLQIFATSDFALALLGKHGLYEYITLKQNDITSFKKEITSWEIEHYF